MYFALTSFFSLYVGIKSACYTGRVTYTITIMTTTTITTTTITTTAITTNEFLYPNRSCCLSSGFRSSWPAILRQHFVRRVTPGHCPRHQRRILLSHQSGQPLREGVCMCMYACVDTYIRIYYNYIYNVTFICQPTSTCEHVRVSAIRQCEGGSYLKGCCTRAANGTPVRKLQHSHHTLSRALDPGHAPENAPIPPEWNFACRHTSH